MQEVGFEPTKHYALELKSNPFDHSGILANSHQSRYFLEISLELYLLLFDWFISVPAGLEPATWRLTAVRSTDWAMEPVPLLPFILHVMIIIILNIQNFAVRRI